MRTSTCGEPSPLFGTTCGQALLTKFAQGREPRASSAGRMPRSSSSTTCQLRWLHGGNLRNGLASQRNFALCDSMRTSPLGLLTLFSTNNFDSCKRSSDREVDYYSLITFNSSIPNKLFIYLTNHLDRNKLKFEKAY